MERDVKERIIKCERIGGLENKVVIAITKEEIQDSVDFDRLTIQFTDGSELVITSWDRESNISGINIERKIKE